MLFVVTLAVHIYMVIPKADANQTANWQLGRITFEAPMDSATVAEAKSAIWKVPGIKQAVFNAKDGNLVFAYVNNGELNHDKVYSTFMSNGSFNAELYRPSETELAASCPAIDKSSITYKLGSYFQDLFAAN